MGLWQQQENWQLVAQSTLSRRCLKTRWRDLEQLLSTAQVFIFQGHKDPIVPWTNAALIHQFYSEFVPEHNIEEKSDLQATHGMVGSLREILINVVHDIPPLPAL